MRAAWYDKTGPARHVVQIGELARPSPKAGEVLVRLSSSGINPSDTKKRMGWRGRQLEFPLIVPHHDGAGQIEDVGPGLDPNLIGQRVWLFNAQHRRPFGTAAEYVALPANRTATLPDRASFIEGACLGVPACTAHYAVFADGSVRGQVVLVAGGAGAVGHYAIQFARWGGASVITTVSTEAKAKHALKAGAEHVINYKTDNVVERVREITSSQGVDRIVEVDLGANLGIDVALIKPNGVISSYSSTAVPEPTLPYYPLAYKGVTLRLVQAYILTEQARQQAVKDIASLLQEGHLIHAVGHVFPLEATAAAHEAVETGGLLGTAVISVRE